MVRKVVLRPEAEVDLNEAKSGMRSSAWTVTNFSLWRAGRHPAPDLDPKLLEAYRHIVRYLEVVRPRNPVVT